MADKAARGHGERYGGGSGYKGMTKADYQAAMRLAKAVASQGGSFAQKVGRLRGKLRK